MASDALALASDAFAAAMVVEVLHLVGRSVEEEEPSVAVAEEGVAVDESH